VSVSAYPSYRDSGVEWLGQVPAAWGIKPLKFMADFVNGEAFKPSDWSDEGTPIIRIQNLNGGDDFNFYTGTVERRYYVQPGDLLFGWSGNRGTSFGPFLWKRDGLFYLNQHIFKILPGDCDPAWLHWCLRAVTLYVEQQAHGIIGMVHITKGALGAIAVPVPPHREQRDIAVFLNTETRKIDTLVVEQERLIALLREKRQAVISQAVTKGLDPSVPMTNSGIEWLGEVPKHWRCRDLKHLIRPGSSISYGIVQPGEPLDDGVPFVQTTNMTNGSFDLESLQRTSAAIADCYPRSRLEGGEVILGIRASIGACHVAPAHLKDANLSRGVARIACGDLISSDFLVAYLRSQNAAEYWSLMRQGSTFNEVSIETVRELPVPIPPSVEQQAIVDYLDHGTLAVNSLMVEAGRAIALLSERRTALISAAVTGKNDVRGVVPDVLEAA
jgi:type I restriction enzyme, S subunit